MLLSEFVFKPKKEEKNNTSRNIAIGSAGAVGGLGVVRNRAGVAKNKAVTTGQELLKNKNSAIEGLKFTRRVRMNKSNNRVTPGLSEQNRSLNTAAKKYIGKIRSLDTNIANNTAKYTKALNTRKVSKLGAIGIGALGTAAATRSYLNNRNKRK